MESIGTLNPYEIVNVSSELDGILKTIHVDEGSPVTPGQVIAMIKETDYQLALEQATAILKQAEAALANAKQEHLRKEALYREELVTKQQFDDIVARLAVAQGDVERAVAGLDLAKEKLTKTKIHAPMAGSIKEKKVTAGDYIRNGTLSRLDHPHRSSQTFLQLFPRRMWEASGRARMSPLWWMPSPGANFAAR